MSGDGYRAPLRGFSDNVLKKARMLVRTRAVHEDAEYPGQVWWVAASSATDPYRVQVGRNEHGDVEYITCTCPHGLHRGGSSACSHCASVLLLLRKDRDGRETDEEEGE